MARLRMRKKSHDFDAAAHGVVAARLLPDLDEDVVEQVFGVAPAAENALARREKGRSIAIVKVRQSSGVPPRGADDERFVSFGGLDRLWLLRDGPHGFDVSTEGGQGQCAGCLGSSPGR